MVHPYQATISLSQCFERKIFSLHIFLASYSRCKVFLGLAECVMGEGAPYAWSFMLGVWWHVGDGQSIFCKEEAWELGLFLHPLELFLIIKDRLLEFVNIYLVILHGTCQNSQPILRPMIYSISYPFLLLSLTGRTN